MEAADTIVFAFGRFNPPTTGHEKLIKKVASVAGSNPFHIYPSHTTNPKKDPLPHALKVAYMRKMFKKYAKNIIADRGAKTAIEIAVKLYDKGFKNLIMVVGSDRLKEFDALLNNYNGVEGKRHGYYKFDNIDVISAGERDPDSEGVEGMSASKMRVAAVDGDFDLFSQGLPSGFKDAKNIYRDVRKYMGIREERDMGDMTDFETVRDAYLTGKFWNVGDLIEANGISGEVVRKGTNYLSFADENGKVHKAWLHEITLDEDASVYKKTATKAKNKEGTIYAFGRDKKLDGQPEEKGGYIVWKLSQNYAGDVRGGISKKWVYVKKDLSYSDAVKLMNKRLKYKAFNEEVELDERNYAKEYQNYHSRPEQIANRSSRNKARRVMGDKTKIGMDVGHKDNNPLNNDPKNLRNEDPSDNRREPRLRSKEIDEMSWYLKAIQKIHQLSHPTGYEKATLKYTDEIKKALGSKALARRQSALKKMDTGKIINNIVREYGGSLTSRSLIDYVNKLVEKGVLPQELAVKKYSVAKAEFDPVDEVKKSSLQKLKDFDKSRVAAGKKAIFKNKKTKKESKLSSFRDFVEQIQEKEEDTK